MPPPLPLQASPSSARTGPVKTGGRVFVLDHKRWTSPMKDIINNLLNKYRGQRDMLMLVDRDYAAAVHDSATDPNSMLHPTTKRHISDYVKYRAKLLNTSSSINTSPENLQERQKLWRSLTEGSETTRVPVVPMPPAVVNPPEPAAATPLTEAAIQDIVLGIMERQQQHQQQQQQQQAGRKKQTKTCLSCGQPKSMYENDGSSIHYFYQQGTVRYFYCSTKVYKAYGSEGLTNPRMPFKDFAMTKFFQQELENTKKRVEERGMQKRKRSESASQQQPTGRMCRFCHKPLKQGPNSPHVHTGFPGVVGKYIYCPEKVLSLYKDQGMDKEMTWREFTESPFYKMEKQRWESEKGK